MISKRIITPNYLGSSIARISICLALAVCSLQAQGPDPRVKRFKLDRDVQTSFVWESSPRWEGNMLVGCLHNHSSSPIIYSVDRDGRKEETLFTFPGAGLMHIVDISASRAGEIAIIGSAYTSDGHGTTFIARISADRQHQTVTRVWPYCPMIVTVVAVSSVDCVGGAGGYDALSPHR